MFVWSGWEVTAILLLDKELSQKAAEIDPTLAAANSGLAMYAMHYDWAWQRAERELEEVLS
ncbi:MAG TPA: hypothetical protein VK752_28915 [Bryobacteraceae bacterium]|jgi:hypothetical protein|nr:hypothetical protein [Bryobacteraceae bacterium]